MTQDPAVLRQQLLTLVEAAYSESLGNQERQEAIETLQRLQTDTSTCPEDLLVAACLQLWGDGSVGLASRTYMMTLLHQGVLNQRIQLTNINLQEVMRIAGAEEYQQAPKIFIRATSKLLAYAGVQLWPQPWEGFLAALCTPKLHEQPMLCSTLEDFLVMACDPRLGGGKIRKCLSETSVLEKVASSVVSALGAALGNCAQAAHQSQNGRQVPTGLDATAESLFHCIEALTPLLPGPSAVWHLNLDQCVLLCTNPESAQGGLGHLPDFVERGLSLGRTIMSCSYMARSDDERAANLLRAMCERAAVLLIEHELWGEVHELLTTLKESIGCKNLHGACAQAILTFCARCLGCPSIVFAQLICELITPTEECFLLARELGPTDLTSILETLFPLLGKSNVHPERATEAKAVDFSILHFSTVDAFDQGFAEFRKAAGLLVEWIGKNHPIGSLDHMQKLVNTLQLPTENDQKTQFGHVTQNSQTFCHWNTAHFLIERLSGCFGSFHTLSQELQQQLDATECFQLLMSKRISDATLAPVYMNLMACFWKSPSLEHWPDSIETMFHFLTCEDDSQRNRPAHFTGPSVNFDDQDLVAARKRGATLLIQAAADYGATLFTKFGAFVERIQGLLMQNQVLPGERGFLYETVATLSNGLEGQEQRNFLMPIFEPQLQQMNTVSKMVSNSDSMVSLLTGDSPEQRQLRTSFRESISVIGALLRRCQPSPLLSELASSIYEQFCELLMALHSLTPDMFPQQYRDCLDLSSGEKEQFRGAQNRRSNHQDKLERVRGALKSIRLGVYQAVGTFPSFLKQSQGDSGFFINGIVSVLQTSSGNLHVHVMKQFNKECLVPLILAFPEATLSAVLPILGQYIETRGSALFHENQSQLSSTDAEILERQLGGFNRDMEELIKPRLSSLDHNTVCGFLCCLLRSRIRVRSSLYFVLTCDKTLAEGQRCEVFAEAAQVVCTKVPNAKERDSLLGMLCDLYVRRFPQYAKALGGGFEGKGKGLGIDDARIGVLHQQLMMCRRMDDKKKKFSEFMEEAARGGGGSGSGGRS